MNKRYSTFYQMLKDNSDRNFVIKYYLKIIFFKDIKNIEAYQDLCRVYLDEYPEQKEERINWFGKYHDMFKHIYTRFLRRN